MAKVDYRRLSPETRQRNLERLMKTLGHSGLSHRGQEFLHNLLMESEVTMFARRIEIARLLVRGFSFLEIQRALRVGINNIMSVDRWLAARMYAYRLIVEKVRRQSESYLAEDIARALRRTYPDSALLIELLLLAKTNRRENMV